ncbi:hypothetical protein ACLGL1_02020 [Peptococcus simiae]|uniref:hypothetical protein n=1 Tax=Peptococcus simiae TaxID=1643805 RepID=UPI00397F8564
MRRQSYTYPLALTAICVGVNLALCFVNTQLKLPIYIDTVGTMTVAALLGAPWAVACAVLSAIANTSMDAFALPFLPQSMTTALLATLVFRHPRVKKLAAPVKGLIVGLPAAMIGALIAAYIFGGVTSAGSSYILQFMTHVMGMPLVASAFIVQVVTDYLDKTLIIIFVGLVIRRIPGYILERLQ